MYRLGCFRDDIIFLIFLYQRWIYRVDHSRVNEFGISGEDIKAAEQQKGPQPNAIEGSDGNTQNASKEETAVTDTAEDKKNI